MKTIFFGILMAVLAGFCSCSKDNGEEPEPQVKRKLGLTNYAYSTNGKAASFVVRLQSSDDWQVEMSDPVREWVKIEPESGKGGDAIVNLIFRLGENLDPESDVRKAIVTFRQTTNDTVKREFEIVQYSNYKLKQDSVTLVKIYHKLNGDNWTRPWDLKAPMSSWEGVRIGLFESLSRVTRLEFAGETGNNLQGEIPEEVGDLAGLQALRFLNEKGLTGTIPRTLKKNTQLDHLYINATSVGGLLPLELQECKNMYVLELRNNKFNGFEEGWIGDFPKLSGFNIAFNLFEGALSPDFFQEMRKVNGIFLDHNNFEGTVPRTLFSGKPDLMVFYMSHNRLSGKFPRELSTLPAFKDADPEENICPQQEGYKFDGDNCPLEKSSTNNY